SVWTRTLTEAEIEAIRDGAYTTVTGFDAQCEAWWKMDEGNGAALYDSSTKGRTATIYNDATWVETGVSDALYDLNGDGEIDDLDFLKFHRIRADAALITEQDLDGELYYVEMGATDQYYVHTTDGELVNAPSNETITIKDIEYIILEGALLEDVVIRTNKFCDLNNDGLLDASDEAIMTSALSTGTYTSTADLDGDLDVDGEDYFIFKSQLISSNKVSRKIELEGAEYYLSERDEGGYMLTPVQIDGTPAIFSQESEDLAGNDTLFRDIKDRVYVAYWDEDIADVRIVEKSIADLDGDGDVDAIDWSIMEDALGSARRSGVDGTDAVASKGWQTAMYEGEAYSMYALASSMNNWVEYEIDILQTGAFDIDLQVKNDSPYNDLPISYQYAFDLYLDGATQKAGTIYVTGSDTNYVEGTINIGLLEEGKHILKLVWSNSIDAMLAAPDWAQPRASINRIFIDSQGYDEKADLNLDGVVDFSDLDKFFSRYSDSSLYQKLVVGDTNYYVIDSPTDGRYIFYDNVGHRNVSDEYGRITLGGVRYQIREEDNLVSLESAADINSDGIVDDSDEVLLDEALGATEPFEINGNQFADISAHDIDGYITFDGSNDFIDLSPADLPTGNTTYTMGALIYADQHIDYMGIMQWGKITSYQMCDLRLENDGATKQITNRWYSNDLTVTVPDLTDGWHHVAATYDGTTRKIWIDGVVVGSDVPTNNLNITTDHFWVGKTQVSSERFDGAIDDVAVFDRALTEEEMQDLVNNDLSGLGDSLQAYYSFDYDTVVDESFNGNDGILTNGAAYAPAEAPANQGWRIDADTLCVEPLDEDDNVYHVTYEFEDIHGSGNYDIGLEVKTTSGAVIPMHEFEGCKFMVTVDAVDMGIFTIDPSRTEFAAGSINTMLGNGTHTVKFTWLNPEKDL
ncbi:MAG: LamG-like jellyroll fold domain-containing protein, partial [Candidatus Omnitrophota bacterium]